MSIIETEVKNLRLEMRREFAEMRKLICGKNIVGSWVSQSMACAMLNIKPRRMRDIRMHLDKQEKKTGVIRWRKSAGKKIEYYKPDLEAWLNRTTIQ